MNSVPDTIEAKTKVIESIKNSFLRHVIMFSQSK